jgi:fibronectin-binding autotransporter adhesin
MSGIMSGKGGNFFDPQGEATRGEVSAVIRRFVELLISM